MIKYIVKDDKENTLSVGDTITDFRGEPAIFDGCYHPRKVCAKAIDSGQWAQEYFPSVVNLTIEEVEE